MNFSKLLCSAAITMMAINAHGITLNNNDHLDIYGNESFVSSYDDSTITTHIGSSVSFLDGYNDSIFNITGGEISWLELYDNNTTNISFVEDLSWLLVSDDSTVNIYGSDFSYSNGHLSGIWENGDIFSFWALEEIDLDLGNIGDILPDNIILHAVSVPEPSSAILLILAIAGLSFRRNT